jgi:hypothetical protein
MDFWGSTDLGSVQCAEGSLLRNLVIEATLYMRRTAAPEQKEMLHS